jgi:hypothetical protein
MLCGEEITLTPEGIKPGDEAIARRRTILVRSLSISEGRACYLECDTHDSPSLGIKFEVVQEFGDGHGTLSLAGGSAMGLSATGAWRILTSLGGAAVGDDNSICLIRALHNSN